MSEELRCCKCQSRFDESRLVKELDVETTKRWGVRAMAYVCPVCGHDEHYVMKQKNPR